MTVTIHVPPPLNVSNTLKLLAGQTPKIIGLSVDLTADTSATVDLTDVQQRGQIGPVQTIYINNTGNGQPVTVEALISNISYTIPAGYSGILPFFLPGQAPKFTVMSTGGVVVPIAVLDTPQPATVWGPPGSGGGGGMPGLSVSRVPVTNAQLLNMSTSPVLLVAAPGAGKINVAVAFYVDYSFGTTTFGNTGFDGPQYRGDVNTNKLDNGNIAAAFASMNDSGLYTSAVGTNNINSATFENADIIFQSAANWINGDGTAVITTLYQTITR